MLLLCWLYVCICLWGLFVLSQNTNIYFFYLTLPLADCANVAWKDGNSVTSSVSNHGSCCDMISLVVCLWLSTLTGKYELSPLCLLCGSKLLANSSCAHLFFFLFFLLWLRDKKIISVFSFTHFLLSCKAINSPSKVQPYFFFFFNI